MQMFPVIFVSLGPGEPELITVKGLKALQTADCIFCPETLAKDGNRVSRAADILLQLDIPENTVHRFPLPMSKQREKALSAYDEVYMESSTLRQQGKKVCIVAEGDAGFYSSIHYVYDKLQADGIPVKHIPGIPAFIAAGALGRAPCGQPGRAADGDTRHYYDRRDRETDKRKQCGCHHEAVQMHR